MRANASAGRILSAPGWRSTVLAYTMYLCDAQESGWAGLLPISAATARLHEPAALSDQ